MSKASSSKSKSSKSPPAKKSKIKETDDEFPLTSASASSSSSDLVSAINVKRKKCANNVMDFKFNKKRCRIISKSMDVGDHKGGILYWMSRDQRIQGLYLLKYL